MCLFRLLFAVLCYTMFPHNYRSRSSSFGCIFSNDPLDRQNFNRQRPSSVQDDIESVHISGVWIHVAATSLTTQRWASDLRDQSTHLPVFLQQSAGPAQHHVHNKEEWNAGITDMTALEGDAHDCDPVGHRSCECISRHIDPSLDRQSLAGQFCSAPVIGTLGRFIGRLCHLAQSYVSGNSGSVSLPPLPDIVTTCTLTSSSLDSVDLTSALWPHVSCCSHRRDSNSMPRLQVSPLTPTCAPYMAYMLKRHLYDLRYVQLSQ